jgi:hypothetical protein
LALGPAVSCAGRKRGLSLGAVAAVDSDPSRTTHCGFLSGEVSGNDSCRLDLEPTYHDPALRAGFLIGEYLTATPLVPLDEMTLKGLESRLPQLWAGCLLMSILGQLLSYYLVNTLWRFTVLPDRRNRNRSARFNFDSPTTPDQHSKAVI